MMKRSQRFAPAVIMCKNVYYDRIDKKYYCTQHTKGFVQLRHCRCCKMCTLEHDFEYVRKEKKNA